MLNDDAIPNNMEIIALVNADTNVRDTLQQYDLGSYQLQIFKNGIELVNNWTNDKLNIVAILSQSEAMGSGGIQLLEIILSKKIAPVPFILIVRQINENLVSLALRSGIADLFILPLHKKRIETRLPFLIKNWPALCHNKRSNLFKPYRIPFIKRVFDIAVAGTALLLLSPLLLLIIILIKLESKGPFFYYALRVGTGYKIFKFYKLRSMYVNADKRLKDLKHLNQYNTEQKESFSSTGEDTLLCSECKNAGIKCQLPLYADNVEWCEKEHLDYKKTKDGSAFIKIKNDPRITKIGKFIRNTSIDELPQLWNVIIGDMSIVGNRPLPLYEAEKLTTDKYALRFIAPAGITGLWQVEKRGSKGEMNEEERLMLDNSYAKNHSFLNDIKLILKTVPALFQKENV